MQRVASHAAGRLNFGPPVERRVRQEELSRRATDPQKAARPAVARAEHISIEGEPEDFSPPTKQPHRITRHSYTLASRLRGCCDGAFDPRGPLSWRARRASGRRASQVSARSALRESEAGARPPHLVDLARRVARPGRAAARALLASAWSSHAPLFGSRAARRIGCSVHRRGRSHCCSSAGTTESLEFRSAHGDATLVGVIGGVGSARSGKKFFVE